MIGDNAYGKVILQKCYQIFLTNFIVIYRLIPHQMKQKLVFVCILLMACCFGANGQDTVSTGKGIVSKLVAFLSTHTSEKAYLQFDKPYYAAGDTIYFKAYVTSGELHQLSNLSGVLHADLITPDNKIARSIKLQLLNGLAWGDFFLPDSLPKGNYRVRAYTQWMRNEGDDTFFERILPVGSSEIQKIAENMPAGSRAAEKKADVQFLPEGGSLVSGVKSKIAFKAIGVDGRATNISGAIVDEENNEVCQFASAHLGMGFFYLQPQDGKRYTANVTYADGARDSFKLPVAAASGVVLSVNNESQSKVTVTITANKTCFAQNRNKEYTLLIYSGGIATSVACKLDSNLILLDVAKQRLHTGVATLTLFSPNGEPLGERLLFIQNYDQLNIGIGSDKQIYHSRDKVNVALDIKTRFGSAGMGHFSVSVVDENKVGVNENEENTILTSLLLTSDLKGKVETPNYYFANINDETRNNLDLVMLTNGYRRFEWKPLLNSAYPLVSYQAEKTLEIAGTARMASGRPLVKGTVSLVALSAGNSILSEVTDDKGNFRFGGLMFADTGRFMLQAVNAKGSNNTELTYIADKPAPVRPWPYPQLMQPDTGKEINAYLDNNTKKRDQLYTQGLIAGKMLREVKVKGQRIEKNEITSRYGFVDYTIRGEDVNYGSLSDRLTGRIPLVSFDKGISGHAVAQKRVVASPVAKPMRVVVDGIAMRPDFDINSISTAFVEKVEAITNPITYDRETEGVIFITLKHGLSASEISSKGVLPVKATGFYIARAFYSPKYESPNTVKSTDFRTTIYWNPEIMTDKNGGAKFDYYNADGPGSYRVVIEGIDEKGNLGRQIFRYKIEN